MISAVRVWCGKKQYASPGRLFLQTVRVDLITAVQRELINPVTKSFRWKTTQSRNQHACIRGNCKFSTLGSHHSPLPLSSPSPFPCRASVLHRWSSRTSLRSFLSSPREKRRRSCGMLMFRRRGSASHCKLYVCAKLRRGGRSGRKATGDFYERCTVKFDAVNPDISRSRLRSARNDISGFARDIGYRRALFHVTRACMVFNLGSLQASSSPGAPGIENLSGACDITRFRKLLSLSTTPEYCTSS